MRPAVIASVARNRKSGAGAQRIRLLTPEFSGKKFIVMIFVGTIIFAPGLALTIVGISNEKAVENLSPAHSLLYKVIGPAACGIGVCIIFAAIMYYFCYGTSNMTRSRHQSTTSSGSHHRQSSHSSSHSNPQDALIEDEKRTKRHKRRSREDKKNTSKENTAG